MAQLQATQTQVIILLGPPGAGKGSQAALIKEKFALPHISTGDLLRENIKAKTSLGIKAKTYMDAGQLVPDNLIFEMFFSRVQKPDCAKGYILDGFPRNIVQAETLQKHLSEKSTITAINLTLPDEVIVDRITKRQLCTQCQTPYHLTFSPPKTEGKCDDCEGILYQRSDDTKEVIEKRLGVYREQTAPLIAFYKNQDALYNVDSKAPKEAVLQEILNILG